MAFQNQGLRIVNKKTPVMEGSAQSEVPGTMTTTSLTEPSSVEGERWVFHENYSQLVAQWNNGNNNLSFQEQFWLLERLWLNASTNEDKGRWAYLQQQVLTFVTRQAFEVALEGLQNGTLDPAIAYGNTYYGDTIMMGPLPFGRACIHCYDAMWNDNMEGISNSTQIQMLEERIEYCELMITQGEAALIYNPKRLILPNFVQDIENDIAALYKQIERCRARIAELEGYNSKETLAQVQVNNEPAVE